jgi:iron complex transport system permease protein
MSAAGVAVTAPHPAVHQADRRRARREVVVVAALTCVLLAVAVTSLGLGDFGLSPGEVVGALVGSGDGGATFVVRELRLPRLVTAVLAGASFAVAGGLFQSVLRNPLASPDIIGITQGASVGAVLGLLVLDLSGLPVAALALAGGLVTGSLLYAVAWRGGLTGTRFVVCGIGVAYLAASTVGYLLTRAQVQEAQVALTWITGSVGSARWDTVRLLAAALLLLLPAVAAVRRPLRVLLLGDDVAGGLGVPAERARLATVATGVGLTAVATAVVGPLAFVALTAGPIARRLVGDGGLALVPTALTGAVLVAGADLVATHLLPGDIQAPAGIVTGVVGGPYLVWLLAASRRPGGTA